MFRRPDAGPNFRMGTLRLLVGDGTRQRELWRRADDYGDVWHRGERVRINDESFAFGMLPKIKPRTLSIP